MDDDFDTTAESTGDEDEVPREIAQDTMKALEELQQRNAESQVDIDGDPYGLSAGVASTSASFEPEVKEFQSPRRARDIRTLDDIYSAFPDIGSGSHYLSVYRKSPKQYGGFHVSGFLDDVHQQITLKDFAEKYGGHQYEVHVIGTPRSSVLDNSGRIQQRTLATVKLEIPGAPIFTGVHLDRGKGNGDGNMKDILGAQVNPNVEITRIRTADDKDRRREEREFREQQQANSIPHGIPVEMLTEIERSSDKKIEMMTRVHENVIEGLKRTIEESREEAREKAAELNQLREQLVTERTTLRDQLHEQETRQVKELRQRHEEEVRRIERDQNENRNRLLEEQVRQVGDVNDRAQRERDQLQKTTEMDRERSRVDAERRESMLVEEHRRKETATREQYEQQLNNMQRQNESRLADLQRSTERELTASQNMTMREIESIRSTETNRSSMTESSARMQIGLIEQQLNQANSSFESASRELEEMRTKLIKDPITAIKEAHELAAATGYGGAAKEGDWKSEVMSALKVIGPEVAKSLGAAREQNQQAGAIAQAQQQQHPQLGAPTMTPQPQRAAPQRQGVNQRERLGAPRPPAWQAPTTPNHFGVKPRSAATPAPFTGGVPPEMTPLEMPPGMQSGDDDDDDGMQFNAPAVVATVQEMQKTELPPEQQVVASTPVPPPPEQTQAQPEPPQEQQIQITPEQQQQAAQSLMQKLKEEDIDKFVASMEMAISSEGAVTEEAFAKNFFDQIGPETARDLIIALQPEVLIEAAKQKGSAVIPTREGQKFLRNLWQEIAKLVAQSAAQ